MACQKNNCTGMEVGSYEGLGGYGEGAGGRGGVRAVEEGEAASSSKHDGK